MLLEILGFLLLSALALMLMSEISKGFFFGVFGGIILLLAGLWLIADGNSIEIRDGGNLTGSVTGTFADINILNGTKFDLGGNNATYNETGDVAGNFAAELNGKEVYTYGKVVTPLPFNDIFGIFIVLVGVSTIYFYGLRYYN